MVAKQIEIQMEKKKKKRNLLTSCSYNGHHNRSRSAGTLDKNRCQDANHQTTDGILKQGVVSKHLTSFFASEETEGGAHQIQGTDEDVEKANDKDGLGKPFKDNTLDFVSRREIWSGGK